jgi:EpsI family protein
MLIRALVAACLIVWAGVYARGASAPEETPSRTALGATPAILGPWQGRDTSLADDVVAQLGVDDYINRRYVAAATTATPPISVYVGYYASQRQGDTIHSPQNCLPGAGWQPVMSDRAVVSAAGHDIPVNRVVIQRGLDRQAVYYWYQGRGRVVANEFANKGWLMLDAARRHRTDGGLVRLMTPVTTTADAAFSSLTAFTAVLFPQLSAHLP